MNTIEFIKLKDRHLPDILNIYNWFIKNSTATLHTEPVTTEQLRGFLPVNNSKYPSFLIQFDTALAGYCYLGNHKPRQGYDRSAEITIYLKPEFHRKGIGLKTIHYLETLAIQLGYKNIVAGITGDNESSINLFEKAGFTKCAHYKNVAEKFNTILDVVAYQKEI